MHQVAKILQLTADMMDGRMAALSDILIDVVEGGGEIGFLSPMTRTKADPFWAGVRTSVAAGDRILIVAELEGRTVGTVQVVLSQPENQPHRADLAKMMVHGAARQRGIGQALLQAAEDAARKAGKTLIVLDTAGRESERLYRRAGWVFVGGIPGYALTPCGQPSKTNLFYKTWAEQTPSSHDV